MLRAPDWERRAAVQDPDVRARLTDAIERAARPSSPPSAAGTSSRSPRHGHPETEALVGLTVEEAAARRGTTPIDLLLDVVVPEQLPLTVMLPTLVPSLGASDEGWRARAAIWGDSRVMLGGSDAGAHLDLMCHANYPTVVLGDVGAHAAPAPAGGSRPADDRRTGAPAAACATGAASPRAPTPTSSCSTLQRIASGPAIARHDLPGGGERLYAESVGVDHVFVNGTEIVTGGELTGEAGGTVLRSGRDTETVTVR